MVYHWVSKQDESDSLRRTFAEQEEAEAWLTAFYDDLAENGIAEVSLMEEDRLVYGPMSLLA